MPKTNTTTSVLGHHGVPTGSELFRRQELYRKWPVDKELSVWIEIVRYTTDKNEYAGDDHRFMLHIYSTFKHTLPMYDMVEVDKMLEEDVKWHLEHFNMPAWNRILEKLVHVDKDDGLRVAMEQLMAKEVYLPRPHRLAWIHYPEVFEHVKPLPEIQKITMEGMVITLADIIDKARKWKFGARAFKITRKWLESMAEMPNVSLYEQDWEDLKARVGPKTDDQNDFLKSIHESVGI